MTTYLRRTRSALEDCMPIVEADEASPVAAYLAQYLTICLCAEVQERLYEIVDISIGAQSGAGAEFISLASKRMLRSVKKNEISGFAGMFGKQYKAKLNGIVDDSVVTIYNSVVDDRHKVAHSGGTLISFGDVRKAIDCADIILSGFRDAMSE